MSWNQKIIEEFRLNGGTVGGNFSGQKILLLHTIGAKSGIERVNPVITFKDGDQYIIIASKGGAENNPDWYYNLIAHPEITIEVGTDTIQVKAIVIDEPERTKLYEKMESRNKGFSEYKEKAKDIRVIPVIKLYPINK